MAGFCTRSYYTISGMTVYVTRPGGSSSSTGLLLSTSRRMLARLAVESGSTWLGGYLSLLVRATSLYYSKCLASSLEGQYSLSGARCGTVSAREELSWSEVPARSLDDLYYCERRAFYTATRLGGISSPMLEQIGEEDTVQHLDSDILYYYRPGSQPMRTTLYYADNRALTVVCKPDAVVAWKRNPDIPVVLELARTPIGGPRSVRHIVPRALLYAATATVCLGLASVPLIVSTARDSRYAAYLPPPRPGMLSAYLDRLLDLALGRVNPRPRRGEWCAHCLYRRYCDVWGW